MSENAALRSTLAPGLSKMWCAGYAPARVSEETCGHARTDFETLVGRGARCARPARARALLRRPDGLEDRQGGAELRGRRPDGRARGVFRLPALAGVRAAGLAARGRHAPDETAPRPRGAGP